MGRYWRGAMVALSIAGVSGAIGAQAAPAPASPAAAPARPAAPAGSSVPSAAAALANGAPVVAIGSGGGAFADSVVSFNLPAMTVKAAFTKPGANFTGAPVVFANGAAPAAAGGLLAGGGRGGRGGGGGVTAELVAAQGGDGRVYVLDSDLSVLLAVAAPASSAGKGLGLVTFIDSTGQRWLVSASTGSLNAYRISVAGNEVSLTKGWSQGGLSLSSLPSVAGGVVFASSSAAGPGAPAARPNTPKGLYAFDGKTGARM